MATALSPARLKAARRVYYLFNTLNSFSFVFVSGTFITLYALKLGASNALVGLLNSFGYATFFFPPIGKKLVKKRGIVGVFAWGWLFRYFTMIPLLFAPLIASKGQPGLAMLLVLLGVAGFNILRGISLIGNNPVLAFLAEGKDRGAFIVNVSIVCNVAGIVSNLLAAFFLGSSASFTLYLIFLGIGLVTGIAGALLVFRTPEPEAYRPRRDSSLIRIAAQAWQDRNLRLFFTVYILLSFVAAMTRSFLPVYAKELYSQGDDIIMLYSLLASLGAVAMGFLTRLLVDRIGAKPLYIIFAAVAATSLVPAIFSPRMDSALSIALYLGAFNFISSFGLGGEENAGQTYYFALVPKEQNLELSVIYYFAYGIGGALGAGLGGVLLETFAGFGCSTPDSYRLFFGLLSALFVAILLLMRRLTPLGSASVRESLGIIFSPRDLRTLNLMDRLDRSGSAREEMMLIQELGRSGSPMSQHELLSFLGSPRFELRMEALLALENIPGLDRGVLKALENEVRGNPFTTAYVAARILGKNGSTGSLPVLRESIDSDDYLLQGTAMVALARLGDSAMRPRIEEHLIHSQIPRVRVQAAYALELMDNRASLPALLASLRKEDPPAYVSDELVLAIASLSGFIGPFYPMYRSYSENRVNGRFAIEDALGDCPEKEAEWYSRFEKAMDMILADPPRGEPMVKLIAGESRDAELGLLLSEAALDQGLSYPGFRFFLSAYVALTHHQNRSESSAY